MKYKLIFLVDDNPTTIFYNKDVISDFDEESEVQSFEDPNDFIQVYREKYNPNKESMLLLLDVNMPQKLGYEVLEELEETFDDFTNLDVLMVTSSNLKTDLEKSSRFGCVLGYIEKPLTVAKLSKALHGEF